MQSSIKITYILSIVGTQLMLQQLVNVLFSIKLSFDFLIFINYLQSIRKLSLPLETDSVLPAIIQEKFYIL